MINQQLFAQQQLMKAIFTGRSARQYENRGLEAYRRNLLANATRALQQSFAVVNELIGQQAMQQLTKEFLLVSPPVTGNWSQWGEHFADWLTEHAISNEFAYLPACAALDWQLHALESQPDYQFAPESLQLLQDDAALGGHFILNPYLNCFSSDFPVADIWAANQQNSQAKTLHMQSARQHLQDGKKQNVLVWRKNWKASCLPLDYAHYQWIKLLQQGLTLDELLSAHEASTADFSFQQWLPFAIEQHIIIGFRLGDDLSRSENH